MVETWWGESQTPTIIPTQFGLANGCFGLRHPVEEALPVGGSGPFLEFSHAHFQCMHLFAQPV